MAIPIRPAPKSFEEMAERFLQLEMIVHRVADGTLDQAQQIGRLMAAFTELQVEVRGHRGRLESVPEMVDERIDGRELAEWRARKAWIVKVIGAAAGTLLALAVAYLIGRMR